MVEDQQILDIGLRMYGLQIAASPTAPADGDGTRRDAGDQHRSRRDASEQARLDESGAPAHERVVLTSPGSVSRSMKSGEVAV
jgi:hypothetical protein